MTVADFTLYRCVSKVKKTLTAAGFQHFRNARRENGLIILEVFTTGDGWVEISSKVEDVVPKIKEVG